MTIRLNKKERSHYFNDLLVLVYSDTRTVDFMRPDAARVFFKSHMMENRFIATRREGLEMLMYAAPASRATGPHTNNCIHGLASRTKVLANHAVQYTTPETGTCRRQAIQRSFLLTGPRRPAT